jgi:6-phosphogluconate dehydrogenase
MPGGDKEAWQVIKPIFEAVAAKVDNEPCVDYMGERSAGNYVKMVHNGIEYGLMELISEIYDILKRGLSMSNIELHRIFNDWNKGRLRSFLIEITADIFTKEDDQSSYDVVDIILDKAKQKGTGKWTSQNAMDLGVPIPTIDVAVSMRQLSSIKETRVEAEKIYGRPSYKEKPPVTEEVEKALYFAFLITYAQGMSLLRAASAEYSYGLNMERIAKIWRGGCIIRAELLEDIRQAFDKDPDLVNLLLDKDYAEKIKDCRDKARKVLNFAVNSGLPASGLASAVSYFDSFKTGRLPMNLVQAQRDYFGSHTYERVDKEGTFHTEWSDSD